MQSYDIDALKHIWHKQVYDILQWLIKIFFACSIGFEVPIRDLWTPSVLTRTFVFLLAAFGKLATGLLAQPLTWREGAKVGFAMAAWGEFAFIVATASREAGSLSDDDYAAVVFAVLLSAIYSPSSGMTSGGVNILIGGKAPSNFSTCTSADMAVGPCARLEVPTSRVRTLGLP